MSSDETAAFEQPTPPESSEKLPAIEDAYAPSGPTGEDGIGEDEAQLLDSAARSFPHKDTEGADDDPKRRVDAARGDDTSDTDTVSAETKPSRGQATESRVPNWDREVSARAIIVELKRVETEIRQVLDTCDTKQKRKLGGTRRWHELEEDVIAWRFNGRPGDEVCRRVQQLVARRHYLFRRLCFLSATRPTWNS